MKKAIMLTAAVAIMAGACGKKDKVEEAANKVDNAAEKVVEKATKAKEAVAETTDAYGSGSDHMDSKISKADHELLMKSCLDEGKTKEVCGCLMTATVDGLKAETLNVIVAGTKVELSDGAEAGEAYLAENMTQDQMMEFFGVMPKLMECDPTIADSMQ